MWSSGDKVLKKIKKCNKNPLNLVYEIQKYKEHDTVAKGEISKNKPKTPYIWFVKYIKFEPFYKKHVSLVDLMPRD